MPVDKSRIEILELVSLPADIDFNYINSQNWDVPAAVPPDTFLPDPILLFDKPVLGSQVISIPSEIDFHYIDSQNWDDTEKNVPAAVPPATFPPDPVLIYPKVDKTVLPIIEAYTEIDALPIKTTLPAETNKPKSVSDEPLPVITGNAPVTVPVQITNTAPVQNTASNELIATVNELLKKANQTSQDKQATPTQSPVWLKYLLLGIAAFVVIKLLKK